ncbi:MAG TPA: DUF2922 domain-containing protein [Ureibacillus sp.]|nr:DUF2922 domain-containing protein [Ureibacillus sp.]
MEEKSTILQMDFTSHDGKSVAVKMSEPREDLTATEVETVMNLLNDLGVLVKINGGSLQSAKLKGAKVVETITSEFGITVD